MVDISNDLNDIATALGNTYPVSTNPARMASSTPFFLVRFDGIDMSSTLDTGMRYMVDCIGGPSGNVDSPDNCYTLLEHAVEHLYESVVDADVGGIAIVDVNNRQYWSIPFSFGFLA